MDDSPCDNLNHACQPEWICKIHTHSGPSCRLLPFCLCYRLVEKRLYACNIWVSRISVYKFLHRYSETASIARKPGPGWPSRNTQEIKQIIKAQMQEDDETWAMQLHALLKSKGINISCQLFSVDDLRLAGPSMVALTAKWFAKPTKKSSWNLPRFTTKTTSRTWYSRTSQQYSCHHTSGFAAARRMNHWS